MSRKRIPLPERHPWSDQVLCCCLAPCNTPAGYTWDLAISILKVCNGSALDTALCICGIFVFGSVVDHQHQYSCSSLSHYFSSSRSCPSSSPSHSCHSYILFILLFPLVIGPQVTLRGWLWFFKLHVDGILIQSSIDTLMVRTHDALQLALVRVFRKAPQDTVPRLACGLLKGVQTSWRAVSCLSETFWSWGQNPMVYPSASPWELRNFGVISAFYAVIKARVPIWLQLDLAPVPLRIGHHTWVKPKIWHFHLSKEPAPCNFWWIQ